MFHFVFGYYETNFQGAGSICMKRIALIECAVGLSGERGSDHYSYMADYLCRHGYKVDLYTSSFHHWDKRQRKVEEINRIRKETKYGIFIGWEPGYKKNVGMGRIISHGILALTLSDKFKKENTKRKYDIVYCVIPDNFLASRIASNAHKMQIPLIIDTEDLWPQAMKAVFNPPIIGKIIYAPYTISARKAYRLADGYVGSSNEYRDVPLSYCSNSNKHMSTVFVGSSMEKFDAGVARFEASVKKPSGDFWIVYAGMLGDSYDIETLIKVSQNLYQKKYKNIYFKILGKGPKSEGLKKQAAERPCNVEFLGFVEYPHMAAWLSKSDIVINSIKKRAPQGITTKISDYLFSGTSLINTSSNAEMKKLVDDYRIGLNVPAENQKYLEEAILKIYSHEEMRKKFQVNARRLAEQRFDRESAYQDIIKIIEDVTD